MKKSQVTIHDIAKELNISASTVSRALADHPRISKATKARVKKYADEMNFSPNSIASSLRKGRGNLIGIIVPNINRHFFSNVIESIEREAGVAGYNVLICQSQEKYENEVRLVQTLLNTRVDGIIISVSLETHDYSHFQSVINRGIPLIFFDRVAKSLPVSYVELDDYKGAYDIVNHLINEGCKHIAFFGGPQHINVYQNRRSGYIDALLANNINIESNILFEDVLTKEKGYETAAQLFEMNNKPDAIFAASDFSALGAILYLKEHNIKIPQEVAIAGFANEPFTALAEPALTSVEQNAGLIGKTAAELFLSQIQNENDYIVKHECITPDLILRKSSLRKTDRTKNEKSE